MTRRAITPVDVLLCASTLVSATAALLPLQHQVAVDKRTVCLTNLKMNATAIAIYEADYDDYLPRAKKWMDSILPYTRNEKSFHCPSVASSAYGYALSSLLAGKNAAKIVNPASEALSFDSIVLSRSAVSTLKTLPKPGRHEGKDNVAYADTHAKSMAPN